MSQFPKHLAVQSPDLSGILKLIKKVSKSSADFVEDFQREEADLFLSIVQGHIDKQDLPWKPLSDNYFQYKKDNNLSLRTWEATKDLRTAIRVIQNSEGYYIGGTEGELYGDTEFEVNALIAVHEKGSVKRNIPARPLFEPSRKEWRKGLELRFAKKSGAHMLNIIKSVFK